MNKKEKEKLQRIILDLSYNIITSWASTCRDYESAMQITIFMSSVSTSMCHIFNIYGFYDDKIDEVLLRFNEITKELYLSRDKKEEKKDEK